MSGCKVCGAPVKNPSATSHLNSKRHQAGEAQLFAQGGGRRYRGDDYEQELDVAMPGDESDDYTSGSDSELESPAPRKGRGPARQGPGSWPGAGKSRGRQTPAPWAEEEDESDGSVDEGSEGSASEGSESDGSGEEAPYS